MDAMVSLVVRISKRQYCESHSQAADARADDEDVRLGISVINGLGSLAWYRGRTSRS